MDIDILIDKLTPCLVEIATGKVFQTTFALAKDEDLVGLQSQGWNFNWMADDLKGTNIYKLTLKDDEKIQGLIATQVIKGAVYIPIIENAPHNIGKDKEYDGVGGHLMAIAIMLSIKNKFGGFVCFNAKNMDLVEHYIKKLHARRIKSPIHEYRMVIIEEDAQKLIKKYTLEGDLDG